MTFDFSTAQRIVFGVGKRSLLPGMVSEFGSRVLIVTGAHSERYRELIDLIRKAGNEVTLFSVEGEPSVEMVERGRMVGIEGKVQVVLGLGGGSVIDAAKAIAALVTNAGPIRRYLEIVGEGKPIVQMPLPFIAIPTTSGAGAEVTRNAVLTAKAEKVKASMRSPWMLPKIALVDPELTMGLPSAVTASTGMDALTQCIEPFLSVKANAMTDAFCRDGMARVARSLRTAVSEGFRIEARSDMSLAALMGGMALANAGLGAVHGFAAPIGGMFQAAHGAICAQLLAPVFRKNLDVMEREGASTSRFDEVAQLLTESSVANGADGVRYLEELRQEFGIPRLSSYGIEQGDIQSICEKAAATSSMKGNPVALNADELKEILESGL